MMRFAEEAALGLAAVRERRPLIHHLTNHVVMPACADITLYAGASPVMTLAPGEAAGMCELADALVINIGTLTSSFVEGAVLAGKKANDRKIPVVFDPVGAGATSMRTEAAERIFGEVKVDIVKGNLAEMSVLSGFEAEVRGVEAASSSACPAKVCREFAERRAAAAVVTGEHDYIYAGCRVLRVKNGHVLLSGMVGSGCMLGSVIACFAAVMDDSLSASAAGTAFFGIAAQKAAERAGAPASFKTALLDSASLLSPAELQNLALIEELGG